MDILNNEENFRPRARTQIRQYGYGNKEGKKNKIKKKKDLKKI